MPERGVVAASNLSWKEEALKRIPKVQKLPGECMKHVLPGEDSLAKQILLALLKASSRRNEPVKLAEIVEAMYGEPQKDKQDVVRLTMDKTLLKCGIVEKIYFSERDVRYFPAAYRFQEVQRIDTGTSSKAVQLVGEKVQLPREYWPLPPEFLNLSLAKGSTDDAISKLEQDHADRLVDDRTYEKLKRGLQGEAEEIAKKLKEYAEIESALNEASRP